VVPYVAIPALFKINYLFHNLIIAHFCQKGN